MNATAIYQVDNVLLVSIRADITDTDILDFQDVLSHRISATSADGVVIDISELDIVDTFVGRVLAQLTGIARLLDAETFVVGMRPAVAMTLVELGMYLPENRTALTLTHALDKMRASRAGAGADRIAGPGRRGERGRTGEPARLESQEANGGASDSRMLDSRRLEGRMLDGLNRFELGDAGTTARGDPPAESRAGGRLPAARR